MALSTKSKSFFIICFVCRILPARQFPAGRIHGCWLLFLFLVIVFPHLRPIPNRNEYRYHLRGVPCIPKGKEGVVSWFVGFCAANIVTPCLNFQIFYVRFCWGLKKSEGAKCAILLRWLIINVLQNRPKFMFFSLKSRFLWCFVDCCRVCLRRSSVRFRRSIPFCFPYARHIFRQKRMGMCIFPRHRVWNVTDFI